MTLLEKFHNAINAVVCVIDCEQYSSLYNSEECIESLETIDSTHESSDTEEIESLSISRTIPERLLEQIEIANLVLLMHSGLEQGLSLEEQHIEAIVQSLNPNAELVSTTKSTFNADLFGQWELFQHLRVQQLLNEVEMEEVYAIDTECKRLETDMDAIVKDHVTLFYANERCFKLNLFYSVFESCLPFECERLESFLEVEMNENVVIRSKGILWLVTRPNYIGFWNQFGPVLRFDGVGIWNASEFNGNSSPKQKLIILGKNLNHSKFHSQLQKCLVTPEEFNNPAELSMKSFSDPFPEWNVDEKVQ
eukprot:CAMPEP_0182452382 /NCGR_PEP_ID=MMETSP1172-20130603/44218_1 /TAXON_ID=708627 /ORGANISM="Timspurckia oligopyrenoides, Strain CCMP3278" /LENGTH=306 /DNA_ID=CAMNT_0024650211 /DNA_START=3547 /DNA_END=4467 /DNA_ORIENTATION=-